MIAQTSALNNTMIKSELNAQLQSILRNFTFGIALRCCFPESVWPQLANESLEFEFGEKERAIIQLAPLVVVLLDDVDRQHLYDQYERSLKRSLLRESHELILAYCDATNQFDLYKKQSWFQFARIIRNVVSHKDCGILREWPKDLKKKNIGRVEWRTRALDNSMVGQPVDFMPYEAMKLFDDQMNFVQTTLA